MAVGLGAVVVTGPGGAQAPLADAAPSSGSASVGPSEDPAPTDPSSDAYLTSLTAPDEQPPSAGAGDVVAPVDVPEPVVEVVPLGPGEGFDDGADPDAVAYELPDLGTSWSAALPPGLVPLGGTGQYRLQPTVPGQSCSGRSPATVAGRQWTWAEEDSNRLDQTSVGLVVTGWPTGTGPEAFADVEQDDGSCSWLDDLPAAVEVVVPSADEEWAGVRSGVGAGSQVLGAARAGDLVVGVEVWNPPADGSVELVGELLEAAVAELRGADPGGAAVDG